MAKTMMNMIKFAGVGLTVGAIAGCVGSRMMSRPRKTNRQTDKVLRSMEDLMTNIKGMFD